MFGYILARIQQYTRETSAIVSIQIVIFSVVLLAMTGLVIDFGRAYSAHSQMRSYVDKAALAAAAQLDGNDGAIDRATAAANAISSNTSFLDGENSFSLKDPIYFLTDNPVDGSGAFDVSRIDALSTDDDAEARYVAVFAEPASVRLQLLKFNLGGDGVDEALEGNIDTDEAYKGTLGGYYNLIIHGQDSISEEEKAEKIARAEALRNDVASGKTDNAFQDFNLSTYAVARKLSQTCGSFSPLVMCNPFEDDDGVSFADAMHGLAGQMRLTIDQNADGTPRLDLTADHIRLGLIKHPAETINYDPDEVCQGNQNKNNNVLPGWASNLTDAEYERLQDMCMLALINTTEQCVLDEVLVKPVAPDVIATAINTYFDIWDEPMDQILHNNPSVPISNLKRNSYFAADLAAVSGRLAREEWAEFYQEEVDAADAARAQAQQNYDMMSLFGLQDLPAPPNWISPADQLQAAEDNYQEALLIQEAYSDDAGNGNGKGKNANNTVQPDSGFENHVPYDQGHVWGPMLQRACLEDSANAACSIHENIAEADNTFREYFEMRYSHYIANNGLNLSSPSSDLELAVVNAGSNYEGYSTVERVFEELWPSDASDGVGNDGDYIETEPQWYEYKGNLKNSVGPYERRRQRITVINCGSMDTYADRNGYSASYADTYVADVVDVIDVLITEPVKTNECAREFTHEEDPLGILPCSVNDIERGSIYAEYIGSASQELDEMIYLEQAELVH